MNFTYEISDGPEKEIEIIEYNKEGITCWSLWSEHFYDWIPQNIEWFKSNWPDRFDEMEKMLICKYDQEYLEYIDDTGTDSIRDY